MNAQCHDLEIVCACTTTEHGQRYRERETSRLCRCRCRALLHPTATAKPAGQGPQARSSQVLVGASSGLAGKLAARRQRNTRVVEVDFVHVARSEDSLGQLLTRAAAQRAGVGGRGGWPNGVAGGRGGPVGEICGMGRGVKRDSNALTRATRRRDTARRGRARPLRSAPRW